MENDLRNEHTLEAFNEALKSNNWHHAVMILRKHSSYFAKCQLECFKAEDKNLAAQLIYAAIDQKCYEVIELLVKQGCDVNYGIKMPYRKYKRSPLFHASKTGCVQIVKVIVNSGHR